MNISIIIPALNESENIGQLVRDALDNPTIAQVIVVDNGSTDDTAIVAADAGAMVISEPRRGYGFACAAGSAAAIESGATVLIYMDGDGSSLPNELNRLIDPLADNSADLVLGSRTLGHIEQGAMPPHQRFGNWLSANLMNRLYHVETTDLGPFRAIRADLLRDLNMQEMTFGWPTEMMVKTAIHKKRILEVPVSWHKRQAGESKVSGTLRGSVLAAYYILGTIIRYSWR
ncbi:MAG: glycosyltransferase family 2 protein [Candidatus Promineifilaceae bacterium]